MTDAQTVVEQPNTGRGRRIAYWVVLVLTTLLATLAIFGVWANRQLLNTDNWTETSTKLLENPAIRDQTAAFITDQLYANVNVQQEIQSFLPPVLQPLAAPAAGAARNLVDDVANKALENPNVQTAWANANREAHQRLVNVVEDKGQFTTTTGSAVYLDITPILTAVAARTGLPANIQSKIPANAGQIEILKSDQLGTAQIDRQGTEERRLVPARPDRARVRIRDLAGEGQASRGDGRLRNRVDHRGVGGADHPVDRRRLGRRQPRVDGGGQTGRDRRVEHRHRADQHARVVDDLRRHPVHPRRPADRSERLGDGPSRPYGADDRQPARDPLRRPPSRSSCS